jgi:hypothetical protein
MRSGGRPLRIDTPDLPLLFNALPTWDRKEPPARNAQPSHQVQERAAIPGQVGLVGLGEEFDAGFLN